MIALEKVRFVMLAVGIGPIGPFEGLIILAVVILIFGVGKLSDVGGALGKSIREFRRAAREPDDAEDSEQITESASAAGDSCSKCGASVAPGVKFCAECGAPVGATVN